MTTRILLDAGHGGADNGASYGGVHEDDFALQVVNATMHRLEQLMDDVEVIRTRIQDKKLTLEGRCKTIEQLQPDVFVSIHCNAIEDNPHTAVDERLLVHGLEIYYRDDFDFPLGKAMLDVFTKLGNWQAIRGLRQDTQWLGKRLSVLNNLEVPCILVELGYLSNPRERKMMLENKDAIADLLAHGILEFFTHEQGKVVMA